MNEEAAPKTFGELEQGAGRERRICRGCGGQASHTFSVKVHDGTTQGRGVANRSWPVCEECGVKVLFTLDRRLK